MPHYCILPLCGHSMSSKYICRFYGFPKQPETLKKWKHLLLLTNRQFRKLKPYSKVCSCHFVDHKKENLPTIYNLKRPQLLFDDSLISLKRKKRKPQRLDDENAGMSDIIANNTPVNELVDPLLIECVSTVQDTQQQKMTSHQQEISILKAENALLRQHIQSLPNLVQIEESHQKEVKVLQNENELLRKQIEILTKRICDMSLKFEFSFIEDSDEEVYLQSGLPSNIRD